MLLFLHLLGRAGCALALCSALLLARPALAQRRTALSWVREPGAESCIGAPELGQRVERIVGPVLAPAPEGQISIEGRIGREAAGFVAHVTVSDATGRILGRRELHDAGGDCRALDDPLAFVIAVAIDPNAALAELPGEFAQEGDPGAELLDELRQTPPRAAPSEPRATPPEPAPRRAGAADRSPDPSAPDGLGIGGAVGVASALGLLPSIAVGFSVEAALQTGRWSHRLRGTFFLAQREPLDLPAEVRFDALQLSVATCPELIEGGGFVLALCGGAVGARLAVEPRGFLGTAHDRWAFGPMLEPRLSLRLGGPVALVAAITAQMLWPRDSIVYELSGRPMDIHSLPAVIGLGTLSTELTF